ARRQRDELAVDADGGRQREAVARVEPRDLPSALDVPQRDGGALAREHARRVAVERDEVRRAGRLDVVQQAAVLEVPDRDRAERPAAGEAGGREPSVRAELDLD